MIFEKYAEMIERIDQMIRLKNTGTPEELAKKLGISESTLYVCLDIMKGRGANIEYDKYAKTYFYLSEGEFDFHFIPKK